MTRGSLVRIRTDNHWGQDILPSRQPMRVFLSDKDDAIYRVLSMRDGHPGMITSFEDVETGTQYHADLYTERFEVVEYEATPNY